MNTEKNARNIRLEKKLSPIHVLALAFGCIIGAGSFVMPANVFLLRGGIYGTAIALFLASLVMIVIALNYDYMINKFPVAGGEFTYAHRAFGKRHAFFCSWFLGLSYLSIVPINSTALALTGRNLLGSVFQFGFHYVVAGYDVYLGEILLSIVSLLFFCWLSIRGVSFTGLFQTLLSFALIGGVLVVGVAALLSDKITWASLTPAYSPLTSKFSGILAILAVAPWAFVGFDTIPQAAEEFRFSPTMSRTLMVLSIFFGGIIYIIINTLSAVVVPDGYATWVEYISDLKNLSGIEALPTFNAARELLGWPGLLSLGIAVIAAAMSGIVGFYMATSRLLYSMSRENVLPEWFGKLDVRYKTPRNAIIFVLVFSLIASLFGRTALGWIVDMASLGAAIGYAYTSASALKYAIRDKNYLIMLTGIFGVIMGIIFAILLLVPIEMFNCSLAKEPYICLVVWVILGAIFYYSTLNKKS